MTARPGEDLAAQLRTELGALPPIVCFANDWFTDPTSKHHIMRTFGESVPILWVEASGMRRPNLGNTADLGRIFRKAKKMLGGLKKVSERVWVLSPPSIPLPGSRLARGLNAFLYRVAVGRALRAMGQRTPPLLWVYTPTVARYLGQLSRSGLVYHCVDRWWEFSDLDRAEMMACHQILCRESTAVFASAHSLYRDCAPLARRTELVPHGVEWEHFAKAALENESAPADLPNDGKPVLGFFGLLQDWVDLELLRKLALRFPDCNVVVIGRSMIDLSRVMGLPNLLLLGQKPYSSLPAYCRAFTVGLVPFVLNELTDAVNPIKLREYLSAGMPVVSTAMPEVTVLGPIDGLHVVTTHDEFLAAIGTLLERPRTLAERQRAAMSFATEGWTGRCLVMAKVVRQQLQGT